MQLDHQERRAWIEATVQMLPAEPAEERYGYGF
jgi:hypothetical protein